MSSTTTTNTNTNDVLLEKQKVLQGMSIKNKLYKAGLDFLVDQRGLIVTTIVVPISVVYDAYFHLRSKAIQAWFSAPKLHDNRVKDVQNQLKVWRDAGAQQKLCTARGGWQSISPGFRNYKSKSAQIRMDMYDILELDEKNMTIRVEPLVNMGQISHYLIPKGYTLPVIPELDDLTVGGLYMGVGIETSSHIYGLFNDTVVEAEVILWDGSVVTCSKTQNRDLFDALPWSYGTLGFLLSCTISIIPCKKFVKVEYIPCHTLEEGCATLVKYAESENPPQFLESLAFSLETSVVMCGQFCDEKDVEYARRNTIGLWYKPWFYSHVQEYLKPQKSNIEYIPIRDYYHRHTRSIFWEMREIIPWGNHWLFRLLLGWAIPPKVSFLKLTQPEALRKLYEEQHVFQDMLVPISTLSSFMQKSHELINTYPIWLCPYRAYDYTSKEAPHRCFLRKPKNTGNKDYEMYIDVGLYGTPQACLEKKPFDAIKTANLIEDYVISLHGFQMLYADSYLTREQFRIMFDHTHYDAMKKKYDPLNVFPQVFDKTCKKGLNS